MVVAPFYPPVPLYKVPPLSILAGGPLRLYPLHCTLTVTLQEEGRGGPGPGGCGAEIPSKHPPRTSALVRGVGQRRRGQSALGWYIDPVLKS